MPKAKKKPAALPAHLEDFMAALEGQFSAILEGKMKPDRLAALQEVEQQHGISIDLEEELAEHPDFADRYRKWWGNLQIGLEDSAVGSALGGKGSATTILRGMGALKGSGDRSGGGTGNGRLVLERHHGARVNDYRKW